MTVTMNGHAPIGADVLSRDEALALADYEQIIERGKKTFIEVGIALAAIHEKRLYRALNDTFEAYCEERWDFTGRRGRQLIEAAAIGNMFPIENARQAAALAAVPAEDRAGVLAEATELGDGKPTAAKIAEAAEARKPDLAPTILEALADAGRDGLDRPALTAAYAEPPEEKDLLRTLDKLAKSGEIVVTATWGGSKKPRKWALASVLADLTPDVERILTDAGSDGRTAWQVAFLIDSATPPSTGVLEIMDGLIVDGRVLVVGVAGDASLYALAEMVAAKTPEPPAVDSQTVPAGGSGSTSPEAEFTPPPAGSPATWTAEQHEANRAEIDRRQIVDRGTRTAPRIVTEVRGLVSEIVGAVDLGATDLITEQMVADLRAAVDLLASRLEASR